jgi:hypothetical protein
MQRIFADKIHLNLNSNIYSEGKKFTGLIEFVSNESMDYMMSSSMSVSEDFTPSQEIKLNFQTPLGNSLDLSCSVICFSRSRSVDNSLTMRMKVLNLPSQYVEFIDTLKPGDLQKKWD